MRKENSQQSSKKSISSSSSRSSYGSTSIDANRTSSPTKFNIINKQYKIH